MAAGTTYNEWINTTTVFTDDGGSFSANLVASTAFDYFPDDAAVNDAIYFGLQLSASLGRAFRHINLFVGTAFAATSVTFVWEYWDSNSWETLTVVDDTDGFTVAGENAVKFDIPLAWDEGTVNSVTDHCWIRCRISAIDTPTEGGAQSTQVVQVGSARMVIVEYTSGTPCDMDTLYALDVANGWDCITKINDEIFQFHDVAWITIGEGTNDCYFTDENKTIIYTYVGLNRIGYGRLFHLTKYAKLTLGELTDSIGIKGCNLIIHNTRQGSGYTINLFGSGGTGAELNLYGCNILDGQMDHLRRVEVAFGRTSNIYDTRFYGIYLLNYYAATTLTWYRSKIHYPYGIMRLFGPSTFHGFDVTDYNSQGILISHDGPHTIYDLVLTGYGTQSQGEFWFMDRDGAVMNLINPNAVDYTIYFSVATPSDDSYLYYKFYFDLKVIDSTGTGIENATVTMNDKDGAEIFSVATDADGDIAQQTVTYKTVYIDGNVIDTTTIASPHTVTISKSGYPTRTIIYTMDRKREEIEKLSPDGTNIQDSSFYDSVIY